MTCRELIDFLMDYQSGGLAPPVKSAFDEHLALCPPCVAYLRTYEETVKLGRGACADPDDEVPDGVPEELVRAILDARLKR